MVKFVHFFGTSLTAGGGFEFESSNQDRRNLLYGLYGNINLQKTQFNFSYPGQFSNLIEKYSIKVNNFGKNGYGNERIYREAFNIINNASFNKDEHFFIFEFSFMGRKELYFNPIDDYISFNYKYDARTFGKNKSAPITDFAIANSYWYDDNKIIKTILDCYNFFEDYIKNILNLKNEYNTFYMYNQFFYSYLLNKEIKFLVLRNECEIPIEEKYKLNFQKINPKLKLAEETDIYDFIMKSKLTILHETCSKMPDYHFGVYGNKLISEIIFNYLVEKNEINSNKIDIDLDFYEDINLIEKRKI